MGRATILWVACRGFDSRSKQLDYESSYCKNGRKTTAERVPRVERIKGRFAL
jgi:hypothetical protein